MDDSEVTSNMMLAVHGCHKIRPAHFRLVTCLDYRDKSLTNATIGSDEDVLREGSALYIPLGKDVFIPWS